MFRENPSLSVDFFLTKLPGHIFPVSSATSPPQKSKDFFFKSKNEFKEERFLSNSKRMKIKLANSEIYDLNFPVISSEN